MRGEDEMRRNFVILLVVTMVSAAILGGCSKGKTETVAAGDKTTMAEKEAWKPTEGIEFVCQSSAGGGSDLMARAIASSMNSQGLIDQSITVNNLTGSGGVKAFSYVQKNEENPFVWETVNSNFFTAPVSGNIDKDYRDYTPLAVIGTDPNVLCVGADSPYNTFEEILAAAKENPGTISIAIGSAGSSGSVATILLESATGGKFNQIPFEGGSDGITAVMGGQVDVSWQNIGEIVGPVENGLMKVVAVAANERSEALPDVPTFKELGYDVVYEVPRAVVAPPNIPEEAKAFYCDAFEKLNASDEWKEDYLKANYIVPVFATGDNCISILKDFHDLTHEIYDIMGLAVN